jgi:hypothetical protein
MEALTLFERRRRHAEWAKDMAEQYRRDAANTSSEHWRNKWLFDAQKMDAEAEWAEKSTGYVQ